ncbi:MAG: hypothetical protein LBM93_13395 [Oscillospiraceae bacterium]|nr:hypothetical protein [Oscillospiraceae bacterium]
MDYGELRLNNLSEYEVFNAFFSNSNIKEFLDFNIEVVRSHIMNVLSNQIGITELLKNSNAGKKVSDKINLTIENNVQNCQNLYRFFSILSEIIKYSTNKKVNLAATSVNLSNSLIRIVEISNDILQTNKLYIASDIETDITLLVNKDRFNAMVMCLFQLALAKFPKTDRIEVSLFKTQGDEIMLIISPYNNIRLESEIKQQEVYICELLMAFFCNTYKSNYFSRTQDGNESFCLKIMPTEVDPDFINLTVSSSHPNLDKLLENDIFSIYHTALSNAE